VKASELTSLLCVELKQPCSLPPPPPVWREEHVMKSLRSLLSLGLSALVCAQASAQAPKAGVLSLGSARSGIVQAILAKSGEHVAAGRILIRLDCRPLEKEIDFRSASLAAAEASLTRVRNGPRPEEIAIAEAGLGVATAREEEAHGALERANGLQPGVTVTRAQLFNVERDSRIADAQQSDASKKLALLKAGSRIEDIDEARAKRDAAAALLEEGRAELDQCSIRAPVSGVVQFAATIGEFVSVYAPAPLATLTADENPNKGQ
jgi:multidrug resistance efflux pump